MFSGVEVGVNYKWNYTCVHCNKLVENENSLDCGKIEQKLKSTQYVYMNDAQRNAILLQAKQNIPQLKTNFKTKWDNSDISLNTRCPHCNKEESPPIFGGWTNEWHKFRNTNGMKDI